jgi:hypothetical protein
MNRRRFLTKLLSGATGAVLLPSGLWWMPPTKVIVSHPGLPYSNSDLDKLTAGVWRTIFDRGAREILGRAPYSFEGVNFEFNTDIVEDWQDSDTVRIWRP